MRSRGLDSRDRRPHEASVGSDAQPAGAGPMPWLVVESLLLRLFRLAPASLYVARDPGARLRRHLEQPEGPTLADALQGDAALDCGVWVGDGVAACSDARAELVALARCCRHDLLICEPVVPGCGIGLHMVRAIDPELSEIATEELADGPERTRERRPWEPGARWLVAHVRPWRFEGDAELAREGFVARLPRMAAAEMILAARRVLARHPRAFELLLLGIEALLQRDDESGARALWHELACHGEAAGSVRRLARERIADALAAPWLESPERAAG